MIERTTQKITSIKVEPVARVFAILYIVLGFVYFFSVALNRTDYITFPLGILAPLAYLNLNLTLPRSTSVFGATFQLACCLLSYSLTGWITGAAVTICFNFVARRIGGIDARLFSLKQNNDSADYIEVSMKAE